MAGGGLPAGDRGDQRPGAPPRRAAAWWAWGACAAGIFCSLGRYNPAMVWLFARPGAGALRYPVKFWLPVAVGGALLCGIGFERLLGAASAGPAGRRFRWTLAGLAPAPRAVWAFPRLPPGPHTPGLRAPLPPPPPRPLSSHQPGPRGGHLPVFPPLP